MGDALAVRPTGEMALKQAPVQTPLVRVGPGGEAAAIKPDGSAREAQGQERVRVEDARRVAEKLNKAADLFNVQLKFSVHKATKEIMVKIVDAKTGSVIREVPPEKMLDLAAAMQEMLGLILDERA